MIDHVVYAARDLEAAADRVTETLGVIPVAGGSHPTWGTRNVLVGLGGGSYLEIIGPDPAQPDPALGRPFGLDAVIAGERPDGVVAWCARPGGTLADACAVLRAAGCEIDNPYEMSRATPAGDLLSWTLAVPTFADLEAGYPFLIDWGTTPHPSERLGDDSTGDGVTMVELTIPRPPGWSEIASTVADRRIRTTDDANFAVTVEAGGRTLTLT